MSEESVDRVRELSEQLKKGVSEIFSSEKYVDYLTNLSRFLDAPDGLPAGEEAEKRHPSPDHSEEAGEPEPLKEHMTTPMYYAIDETAARRAKEAMSFSDYRQGSATSEYRHMVDEAVKIADWQKGRVDPMHHEKIDRLLDIYCQKLAANMNHRNEILGRVPSVMIAGPANFPVRKKEKQNAAMDSNMREWRDIQRLLDKIRSTGMGGISADDPQAIRKLQDKLASLEESQETMKTVNAYYRKNKTLDGCPGLSAKIVEELKAGMARNWRAAPKPFEGWALSNNNAEIHRIKERIEKLTCQAELGYVGWEFDGGRVEANQQENRLQIFFDEKPDADTRDTLKGSGFRWSPKAGAWQRQLTDNAIYAANSIECIQPLTGEKPTELQRKARREKEVKKMSRYIDEATKNELYSQWRQEDREIPATLKWRDDLTPEGQSLVGRWDELNWLFKEETNDSETQEWRDELTPDEQVLVDQWDDQYEAGLSNVASRILEAGRQREAAPQIGKENGDDQKIDCALIATYEELFNVPQEDRTVEYFGDYGIDVPKYGVSDEKRREVFEKGLQALGISREQFFAEGGFSYRGNIVVAMCQRNGIKIPDYIADQMLIFESESHAPNTSSIRAGDLLPGAQVAEADGFLFDVAEVVKQSDKTITVRLCSDYSSVKDHWTVQPDGTPGGVLKTFRKDTTLCGIPAPSSSLKDKLAEAWQRCAEAPQREPQKQKDDIDR